MKKWVLLLFTAMLIFTVTACGQTSTEPAPSENAGTESGSGEIAWSGENKFISIGGATAGGSFFPFSVVTAELFTKNIKGINATGEETGGGIENMNLVHTKQVDIGIATADVAKFAAAGKGAFKEAADLRLGWSYSATPLHIIARADSGINTFEDLAGKKVSVGAPGSGLQINVMMLLSAYGITEDKFSPAYLGFNASAEALQDGTIDAAFTYGALPAAAVQSVFAQADVKLISVDEAKVKEVSDIPFEVITIPAGTYEGQEADVTAASISNFAVLSPDLPDTLVYEMAKVIDNNVDAIAAASPGGENTRLATAEDTRLTGIELHPGIQLYLDEKNK